MAWEGGEPCGSIQFPSDCHDLFRDTFFPMSAKLSDLFRETFNSGFGGGDEEVRLAGHGLRLRQTGGEPPPRISSAI